MIAISYQSAKVYSAFVVKIFPFSMAIMYRIGTYSHYDTTI